MLIVTHYFFVIIRMFLKCRGKKFKFLILQSFFGFGVYRCEGGWKMEILPTVYVIAFVLIQIFQ